MPSVSATDRAAGTSAPTGSARAAHSLAIDPFALDAHGHELLRRRVVLAPMIVVWNYRIADAAAFRGWIGTKEILLSVERMSRDAMLAEIIYGGTYRVSGPESGAGAACRTLWGYSSQAAVAAMHRLGSGDYQTATLIQLELIDFLKGLKTHIAAGGDQHFRQEVMVAAAM